MDDQVALTAYSDEIRALIRNDRNDEAIAIGKHILRYYPKYVEVYEHLGQAFLEKGRHEDAKELFRRVLSADPENIIAYVGLAILLEQEQLIAEAVWHMERAYELSPDNPELHQELHRLYHELDGRPRARLKLTPGALARLHLQEGLFTQAIQELNAIVSADGRRFDAHVALAQALWQAGQMRPAAEAAQTILKTLPYCLKANLILGTVWKEIGLAESEQYLQRAQELDPTNRVANQIFGARSPLPLAEPRVPRYVETAPVAAPVEPAITEPVVEIPSIVETPIAPAETALPPWLATPSQEVEIPRPSVAEAPTEFLEEEPQPEPMGEVPDWLARLRETAEPPAPTVETEGALPSWLPTETQAPEFQPPVAPKEAESALPPWLAEIAREEPTALPSTPTEKPAWFDQLEPPADETRAPAREEELPPWLAQPTPEAPRAEELPPWLAKPTPTEAPRAEIPRVETPERAEELPSWLAQPTPETPRAEMPRVEAPERAEELPPWLAQPTPTVEPPRAQAPERAEELPPWMAQPTPTEEPREQAPARAEETPAWWSQLAQPTEPPRERVPARAEETPREAPVQAEELPAWLAQPTPTPEPPRREEVPAREEPAWMTPPTPTTEPPRAETPAPAEELPPSRPTTPPTPEVEKARPAAPRAPTRKAKPSVRGESHLLLARAYRDANQIAEALREYDLVVQKAPRLVKEVIADLEVLAKRPGVPLEVHRILGDAYTRADRLAEALAEYRLVLERVSS
ncbi:MAG: tetratricopeptide repeat protein [Anaerolineae bacterium]|nr:tetratricopeptide repeat protein [Anaerolineae bacterium]